MTFLVVGVDRATFARWHANITADGIAAATEIACARAALRGIRLHVAAVIGPNSTVLELTPDGLREQIAGPMATASGST
ncbi:MAG TPA: hypothetical protein VD836_13725 [Solirubrobacteraceae bacterium]|nr:hypothetical protein [Solirubrobacteraceae bacterium]